MILCQSLTIFKLRYSNDAVLWFHSKLDPMVELIFQVLVKQFIHLSLNSKTLILIFNKDVILCQLVLSYGMLNEIYFTNTSYDFNQDSRIPVRISCHLEIMIWKNGILLNTWRITAVVVVCK